MTMRNEKNHKNHIAKSLAAAWLLALSITAQAQTPSFTFQGRLNDNAIEANGTYEMQFSLFDAATNGNQVGATVSVQAIAVTNGIFTVNLNFGAGAFTGANRFLQVAVRSAGDPGPHTVLTPRQLVTSTPYSIKSLFAVNAEMANIAESADTATNADNADKLGGIPANQYVLSGDSRLSNSRDPNGGSFFYIQNRQSQQPLANFNISGDGTIAGTLLAGTVSGALVSGTSVNSATEYGIAGNRILAAAGVDSIFVGRNSGLTSTGSSNSFIGGSAGRNNTTGFYNSFVGFSAGRNNQTGHSNSIVGNEAGYSNISGDYNSFFGRNAGYFTLFGKNSFFGAYAGGENVNGSQNSFFGFEAGSATTSGNLNVFAGHAAGNNNTGGSNNTLIGAGANVASGNLTFATAIGAGAVAMTSHTITLGTGGENVDIPGTLNLQTLGAGGSTILCRNGFKISTCSSSLRYKTNISPFAPGLSLVKRLAPITFDWKSDGMRDLGLGAEDVATIEPLLVTYNSKGQVEGVKYDRIGLVVLNAVKEQQSQIEAQQIQITRQQVLIDALKKMICEQTSRAEGCK